MTIKHKHYLWLDVSGEDTWFSSRHLIQNLKKSYKEKLGQHFHVVSLPMDQKLLRKFITENQITSVILADPRINLSPILAFISGLANNEIEFLIHITGSPVRRLEELKKINIDKYKVCLLAGARSNYEILKNYSDGSIKYFPFLPEAIHPQQFQSQSGENKYIYFGRISHQKNILGLLDLFSHYQLRFNPEAELSIYGGICNANFPTKPFGQYIGMTGERFFSKLSELQSKGHKINYYGLVGREELHQALKKHDTFLSLSTADEEDFGMSVYEALCYGLKCILSKWGGHREFENFKQVDLLTITHQDSTLYLDQDQFFESIMKQKKISTPNIETWLTGRKSIINQLDLTFDHHKHNIKLDLKFNTEEFFNEQQKFVSPYWR